MSSLQLFGGHTETQKDPSPLEIRKAKVPEGGGSSEVVHPRGHQRPGPLLLVGPISLGPEGPLCQIP